jgi:hypothetical protein
LAATAATPLAGPRIQGARWATPPKATTSASGATAQPIPRRSSTREKSSIVPDTRLISDAGTTIARNSDPTTENTTTTPTHRAMARGTVRPGSRVSRAWKPAISMPVKSRMMPPRKARLLISTSGTSAPAENGICVGLPCARNAAASTTSPIAGMMDPAIVPTEPIHDDVPTPRRLTIVVAQKNASMTTTRKTLSVASEGSSA